MKIFKISVGIVFSLFIIFQLLVYFGSNEKIRVIESISKNEYKLVEDEYSVTIPEKAVIKSMYENKLFFTETLHVILVMPEDEEQNFINSIKISSVVSDDRVYQGNANYDNLPIGKNMLIEVKNQKIDFKCYKTEEGEVEIRMNKIEHFSKEMSKLLSTVKYHDLGSADRGKGTNFQN